MKKHICIHGHFYQPPREDPWTGEVEAEESAKPFHDWNERITKECYEANTQAPILNAKGEPSEHVNNFKNISFDIGPTLLTWLRKNNAPTYRAILAADRESALKHGGHGNAMAQVYNHLIMPLAKKRDKITQVRWGIRDFEFHFKRKPEGMWLSETAVDRESLEILADHEILFTVLAPHQASRKRHIGFGHQWEFVPHEGIDPKQPYRVLLSRGRQFHVFFYDGPVSRAIAFQGLLMNGDQFAQRLMNAFGRRDREQLVSTATDGESFGHHHKFGEMALAYASKKIAEQRMASLTNYAEYLSRYRSYWEADIHENSSWSCAHGVERWRSDCGCRLNHADGWNQKWRGPLREAFDHLSGIVDKVFEKELGDLVRDPWEARNDYIELMLDNSEQSRYHFFERHALKRLSHLDVDKIIDLLEAQRFALYMYTSCGWFFDEISGIEPVKVMKYALRAMELAQPFRKEPIEPGFLKILASAKSNLPGMGTGEDVFNKFVRRNDGV